ncbi:retrovirus-related pol polyprotein from transposon TNT 1-94 [Tanacetum coccineum]|uniref:Retrovirus-related pol polyprotein from transposon TNT 1-94 n=1 Tax=Tanacetum coccineum TaxID=301880 RepID=A0ABQ5DCA9_9ASTR
MSLKIIIKNKRLKATRNSLENELRKLKDKLSILEKNKGANLDCAKCHALKIKNEKLKEESTRLNKFEKSTHYLNEMLSNQKPSGDKLGLGSNSFEASSSGTKEIKFVKAQKKAYSDEGPINMGGPLNDQVTPKIIMRPPPATPGSEKTMSFQKSILGPRPKHIIVNKAKVPIASDNEVKQFYKPLSKPGVGFSKPNFRSKTPPPRKVNNNYPRSKTLQRRRHICLRVDLEPDEWIKDSGCSKHMTGNRKLFSTYKAYNGGNVIFGSNLRGNIIDKGQICDNKCKVTFSKHDSEITKDGKVIVPQPRNMTIIVTRWVFRNKLDENGIVSRNKARLVAQGYNQQEGIDYDETYAPVARLESIRILLAYACALDFKIFQMGVKIAFLNGFINEEITLFFTKKKRSNLIIVQIYVDDIIFGSTCQDMCDEFAKIMHDEFEMSMMGELNFFLGLQIKQMEDGIFFNQSKYIKEMLKKFGLKDSKPMKTPMSSDTKLTKDEECTTHLGLWYPKGTGIETVVYADSDHAGDYVDQKSTSGACVFTDRWRLDELAYEGQVCRIRHEEEIDVLEYQVLTREIEPTLKPLEEIIRENVFCLGVIGTTFPHVFVLCFIVLYTLKNSILPITWRNEWSGSLSKLERKPRRDHGTRRGRHSTSSSSAFDKPSSSHLNDDDDDRNDEGTSRASTPSPIRYVNSLTNQVLDGSRGQFFVAVDGVWGDRVGWLVGRLVDQRELERVIVVGGSWEERTEVEGRY